MRSSTPTGTLAIGRRDLAGICRRAGEEAPHECCGVLLGRVEGHVVEVRLVLPAPNEHPAPRRGYAIPARFLVAAYALGRQRGLRIVGTYHSHPRGEASPSLADGPDAWPGMSYLIVCPAPSGGGSARSWRRAGAAGWSEEEIQCRP